ncbi:hypothetical protein E3N88_21463 [Mikania micrantha]|uniref:Secreted protein n=1 Tax=Mikania micrantha TaxID=192012 RepID=A0A5N6NLI7_9ASTR|nr:hypothetical protein E3N88_21463 [Mikania micrantha]
MLQRAKNCVSGVLLLLLWVFLTQKAVAHVFHVQKTAVVVERNHVAWDVVIAPAAAILHAQHVLFVAVASHVFAFKCMIRTLKF